MAVPAPGPQRRGARAASTTLGFVGELHPLVAGAWDLERTAAFAIDLGKLAAVAPEAIAFAPFAVGPAAAPGPRGHAARRTSPRRRCSRSVRAAAGEMLEDVSVFDVYTGEQVGEGRRSLALALSFRALERTLTDEDVAPVRERIVAALGELGGELRG